MPKVRKTRIPGRQEQWCGFSLLEIAVVVAVIMIIVAIAVPNMMRARMKANEASAVASLRTIHAAESMYAAAYPDVGYAGNLADLGTHGGTCETIGKTNSCLIMDSLLTSGVKSGYIFELVGDGNVPDRSYTVTATPESIGSSGRCVLSVDQSGQVHVITPGGGSRFSEASPSVCNHT
jgi:type IV pilus assembly protein PilA